ncbi:hypothetical protein BB560_003373 [Smittium megazygosporum]|uniref:Uncharacterized protein n=1 Tax=Smittium megazygosporum TaxID=133381 RepID=A0A2T9ZC67_9FUNG|nr:hypothetical protein BB560_003373 [Smittium megazygosporum]
MGLQTSFRSKYSSLTSPTNPISQFLNYYGYPLLGENWPIPILWSFFFLACSNLLTALVLHLHFQNQTSHPPITQTQDSKNHPHKDNVTHESTHSVDTIPNNTTNVISKRTKLNWETHIASQIHALTTCVVSTYYLINYPTNAEINYMNNTLLNMTNFSFG